MHCGSKLYISAMYYTSEIHSTLTYKLLFARAVILKTQNPLLYIQKYLNFYCAFFNFVKPLLFNESSDSSLHNDNVPPGLQVSHSLVFHSQVGSVASL